MNRAIVEEEKMRRPPARALLVKLLGQLEKKHSKSHAVADALLEKVVEVAVAEGDQKEVHTFLHLFDFALADFSLGEPARPSAHRL